MMMRIKFLLGSFSQLQKPMLRKEKMFNMNCVASYGADKKLIGPALSESTKLRSQDWIVSFVKHNNALRKKRNKDAIATFKNTMASECRHILN